MKPSVGDRAHLFGAKRRQTGVAGSATAVQPLDFHQPAVHLVLGEGRPAPLALCVQPTDVSVMKHRGWVTDAFVIPPRNRAKHTFGREERHLRVVSDGPAPTVGDVVVGDPCRSVLITDLLDAEELHRRAQRVTDGAAKRQPLKRSGVRRSANLGRIPLETSEKVGSRRLIAPD